ncbi:hypothetical protein TraAM80_06012 [Trypanosoma rangeli]|uniref:FYVE-type domain-containing protein n=1 Tax=Trypanosoma rangeli TaxID=5698 RepID=A0A422NCC4_TRYRA|nr:uncharacterized protein TraAM80_06012 [Trypanosoma rangeli]RNF03154.1 hypothetical protein TraAM80_06012 [Trypanosoma rangeli]|eukprot:RNF03154.1 hypothetical protein TraAM80_06012 [Trypanosoma rangeli]
MTSASACPLCKRHFGILRWRHECDHCKKTVCDDCAPKLHDSRQCTACAAKAKQLRQTQKLQQIPNPVSVGDERATRMRAAEERMKAAMQRGRPQTRDVQHPVLSVETPIREMPQQQQMCDTGTSSSTHADVPTRANPEENPVLAAALRRREQEQLGGNTNRGNSSEKMRLLSAIVAVLHQWGEDEPFGLRSMDETKLQSYLCYLKSKDKSSAVL